MVRTIHLSLHSCRNFVLLQMGPSLILWFFSSLSTIFGSISNKITYKTFCILKSKISIQSAIEQTESNESSHKKLFELIKRYLASVIEVCLFDHVLDIIISELCISHFCENFFQGFESYISWVVSFENGKAFEDMFFSSDGQHHPEQTDRYLAMRARNSPASMVPLLSASHYSMSLSISYEVDTHCISCINW